MIPGLGYKPTSSPSRVLCLSLLATHLLSDLSEPFNHHHPSASPPSSTPQSACNAKTCKFRTFVRKHAHREGSVRAELFFLPTVSNYFLANGKIEFSCFYVSVLYYRITPSRRRMFLRLHWEENRVKTFSQLLTCHGIKHYQDMSERERKNQ